jgi:ABC-type Fe3+ transport system permease subunit
VTTEPSREPRSRRRWWIGGLLIAVLVVVVLAPLASTDPDGLERVAEDLGFLDQAENVVGGLLGGYSIPGLEDPAISTIVSGLVGIAIVVLVIIGIGRLLARRKA